MNQPITGASTDLATPEDPDAASPACVLSFNTNDPSGASGIAADIATISAMGAHALPVITSLLIRDTAEVFESHEIDPEGIADQARSILEDVTITAWKVGFLGGAEGVSAVAEILSDYPDVPLVAHLPNLSWLDDEAQMSYLDAFKELILPAAYLLVGNHKTLTDFLLPDWDSERPPSARELAVAAGEAGCEYVLVTGSNCPTNSSITFWPRHKARWRANASSALKPPLSALATPYQRLSQRFCPAVRRLKWRSRKP